jgi:tripartite-type tricarboxylate transporter receptor subunit TctC
MQKRTCVGRLVVVCLAAVWTLAAGAQAYPSKPIRLISPFPPGAVVDTLCRTLAAPLGELLGQPVIVENRTGAGGNIGMEVVAKAAPDGYTIGMGSIGTHGINPSVYAKMPFDSVRDFAPITFVASNINVLVVHPSVPAQDVRGLIAHAKANPGKLSFGSAGAGTSQHLAGELFKQIAGVEMAHVPYKGAGPAVTDLIGGQIPMMFADISAVLGHIRAGKLRPLGVTTRERSPLLDVPTVIEQGIPDFDVNAWFGLFAPAGTPREIVARLNSEINHALADPEVAAKLEAAALVRLSTTPAEFTEMVKKELELGARFARMLGVK